MYADLQLRFDADTSFQQQYQADLEAATRSIAEQGGNQEFAAGFRQGYQAAYRTGAEQALRQEIHNMFRM